MNGYHQLVIPLQMTPGVMQGRDPTMSKEIVRLLADWRHLVAALHQIVLAIGLRHLCKRYLSWQAAFGSASTPFPIDAVSLPYEHPNQW